jgi:hypothetical protein
MRVGKGGFRYYTPGRPVVSRRSRREHVVIIGWWHIHLDLSSVIHIIQMDTWWLNEFTPLGARDLLV